MTRHPFLTIEELGSTLFRRRSACPDPDGQHMTLSFTDQTAAGPNLNQLFEVLGASNSTAGWRARGVLRHLPDLGAIRQHQHRSDRRRWAGMGIGGVAQSDPRFGDIRIVAYPMSTEVVAVASPFDVLSGTWAGDVKLNGAHFQVGTAYDLFSVLLHEAGHTFGLDHSDDPSSAMFEDYLGIRVGLSMADIGNLQALYGVREADIFDARAAQRQAGNGHTTDPGRARRGTATSPPRATLTSTSSRSAATASQSMFAFHVAGLSLLQARLTVVDAGGKVLGSATAAGPGNDLEIHLQFSEQIAILFHQSGEGERRCLRHRQLSVGGRFARPGSTGHRRQQQPGGQRQRKSTTRYQSPAEDRPHRRPLRLRHPRRF